MVLSTAGILWALMLSPVYGMVVAAGIFFDVFIYTLWLKRRTPWSIVLGGISGGIPVLAGRSLALGYIDWMGILLLLAVLFWIPTHILTFSMKYYEDYQAAQVPTIASTYGFHITRLIIAISSVLAALAMGVAALLGGLICWCVELAGGARNEPADPGVDQCHPPIRQAQFRIVQVCFTVYDGRDADPGNPLSSLILR